MFDKILSSLRRDQRAKRNVVEKLIRNDHEGRVLRYKIPERLYQMARERLRPETVLFDENVAMRDSPEELNDLLFQFRRANGGLGADKMLMREAPDQQLIGENRVLQQDDIGRQRMLNRRKR